MFPVSQVIRAAIHARIQQAQGNGRFLNVYRAAQEIQDDHPGENVALEDIVSTLVDVAGGKSLALEFSNPGLQEGIVLDFMLQGH